MREVLQQQAGIKLCRADLAHRPGAKLPLRDFLIGEQAHPFVPLVADDAVGRGEEGQVDAFLLGGVGVGRRLASALFGGACLSDFVAQFCQLTARVGEIAGLWAEKFDQMAAFQNFIIVPMTFLSGVFYSVHSLPGFWQGLSHLNPFFYLIDGFRRGFFGASDVSPWLSLAVVATATLGVSALALRLLKTGYKIRH